MHVIDRIMSPLDEEDTAAISSTATNQLITTRTSGALGSAMATVTVTATPTATSMALAVNIVSVERFSWVWTLFAVLGGFVL